MVEICWSTRLANICETHKIGLRCCGLKRAACLLRTFWRRPWWRRRRRRWMNLHFLFELAEWVTAGENHQKVDQWQERTYAKLDENGRNLNWWDTKLMKIDETNRNLKLMKIWWKLTKIDQRWNWWKFMKTAEAQNWWKMPIPKSDENLWKRQKPKLTKHKIDENWWNQPKPKIDET